MVPADVAATGAGEDCTGWELPGQWFQHYVFPDTAIIIWDFEQGKDALLLVLDCSSSLLSLLLSLFMSFDMLVSLLDGWKGVLREESIICSTEG